MSRRDVADSGRQVRDTKEGVAGPILTFTAAEEAALFVGVHVGESIDHVHADGPAHPTLRTYDSRGLDVGRGDN